jgi:hypothetical protein
MYFTSVACNVGNTSLILGKTVLKKTKLYLFIAEAERTTKY